MRHLVETALLTHGLRSITNDEIQKVWTDHESNIAWVSEGNVVVGDIEAYLKFRGKAENLIRINSDTLENALKEGLSGALTASGTLAVCEKLGIPLAVTCGMGGISDGDRICQDLSALAALPVALITTGPKDMMDREATIKWLTDRGVQVLGTKRDFCSGYIFVGENVALQGVYGRERKEIKPSMLLIREIPEEKRVQNHEFLKAGVEAGKKAAAEGRSFHPAVNGKIDELTDGYSSRIQLKSLLENVKFAKSL